MLLYKYRYFDKAGRTWDIIRNCELYFSSFEKFNDPFDCNLNFKHKDTYNQKDLNKFRRAISLKRDVSKKHLYKDLSLKQYVEENKKHILNMKKKSGILSLSRNCNNILMWSHYADNHRGVCFGFSAIKSESEECFKRGTPVDYVEGETYNPINVITMEYEKELTRLFSTKSKYWDYEEEFRFITINSNGLEKFRKETLKEVIFGCKANKENISTTINLCNSNGFNDVVFKKAKRINNSFILDFDILDEKKYI